MTSTPRASCVSSSAAPRARRSRCGAARALDDIADEPFAAAEIRRLDELRLNALAQAIDADLADGRHGELVAELEALVAEHPLSERLHGQLMLALYRSGRQAEALEAYRRARERLVDEVGIEPGPDLQRLHAAMLRQDASLDAPPRPELPPELAITSPMFGREAELGSPAGGVGARHGRHRLGDRRQRPAGQRPNPAGGRAGGRGARASAASCSTAPRGAEACTARRRARRCSSRRRRRTAARAPAASRALPHHARRRRAPRCRADPARPARRRRGRGHREAPRAGERGGSARRTQRRAPGRGASHRRRMGTRAGGTIREGRGAPHGGRARRSPARRIAAHGQRHRSAVGALPRRAAPGRPRRHRLSLQGPGLLRPCRRRLLLRARAPDRRIGGAPRGLAARGHRRSLGQREVLVAASRPAGRAGQGRPAGQRGVDAGGDAPRRAPAGDAATGDRRSRSRQVAC